MGSAPWRWRTIEHTADLAVEVEAPSLEWLFLAGAHGMTGVLLGREDSAPQMVPAAETGTVWRELALEAPDREALLVDWLRELLYIQVTEDLLFTGAEIEEMGDTRLVARAAFTSPPDASDVERELKGVTYHDLVVSQRDDGWFARVVFDL
jgi:SHS2 domain-containing protein